jgi:hypothetical protein
MGLTAGTKLGPYNIRSPRWGQGGMGEVYRARDTSRTGSRNQDSSRKHVPPMRICASVWNAKPRRFQAVASSHLRPIRRLPGRNAFSGNGVVEGDKTMSSSKTQ